MKTANKQFDYDDIYLNKTLHNWALEAHNVMGNKYEWKNKPLIKGMFGLDNMVMSLGYVFKYCPNKLDLTEIARYVHIGWSKNYIFWRDEKPWMLNKFYKKPFNNLGDVRRNKLSVTKFDNIDLDEKEKNIIIAQYILDNFLI